MRQLLTAAGHTLHAWEISKQGQPKHPLYAPNASQLLVWTTPASGAATAYLCRACGWTGPTSGPCPSGRCKNPVSPNRACLAYEGCRGEGTVPDSDNGASAAECCCYCPAGKALRARDAPGAVP